MQRTTAPGNSSNLFTDGNPGLGVPATEIEQVFLNSVQEEICNAVTADGTALDVTNQHQLRDILGSIIGDITPGGRLTLTTAVPVTTGDVSGATTVYYTPYKRNRISLYNGTTWVNAVFTELSQATTDTTKSPAAVANNKLYDIFVWNDAGTIRATRGPAWSSDTSRGTGAGTTQLTLFNGVLLNAVAITNGPGANLGRYVGTVGSDGSAQINDTVGRRDVWNKDNQVERAMFVADATASWTYNTATWRQANANTANQLNFVRGLDEDAMRIKVDANGVTSGGTTGQAAAIGLDSTSAVAANSGSQESEADLITPFGATYTGTPGLGRHYAAWLESGNGFATATFYGTSGLMKSCISGSCMA